MTSGSDTTNGWYLLRQGQQYGPYRWEQLAGYARNGTLVSTDLVWHPSLPAWVPAATVPGLLLDVAPRASSSPVTSALPGTAPSPVPSSPRQSFIRHRRVPLFVACGAIVVLAVVLGIVFGVLRSDSPVLELSPEQGPLLPADVPARTIPLDTGGALVIPEGAPPVQPVSAGQASSQV